MTEAEYIQACEKTIEAQAEFIEKQARTIEALTRIANTRLEDIKRDAVDAIIAGYERLEQQRLN